MCEDLQRVADLSRVDVDSKMILESYLELARGPGIFERLVRRDSGSNADDRRENILMKYILQNLELQIRRNSGNHKTKGGQCNDF